MNVQDKTILLIAAKFFGYEKDIQDELTARGAKVDFVPDRPFNSPLMKAITKLLPGFTQWLVDAYYQLYFPFIFRKKYNLVFVVEGITLSRRTLNRLKQANPSARFVLYVWDSIKNRPHIYDNKHFYSCVFTFDPEDARNFGFTFRPLFFTEDFEARKSLSLKYDLSFIGTVHSDRFKIISQIVSKLPTSYKKYIFLYFHAQWFFFFNKLFKKPFRKTSRSTFKFEPISKKEVADIIRSSAVTLDIEHANQVGLTMRTFEVLGTKRKLVTTNTSVRSYDFFNPNNILIINRVSPQIPESFFKTPYEELPSNIYSKYSLKSWINEVLGV